MTDSMNVDLTGKWIEAQWWGKMVQGRVTQSYQPPQGHWRHCIRLTSPVTLKQRHCAGTREIGDYLTVLGDQVIRLL